MSASSGELMIFGLCSFLGNHHNKQHNSLLWPITQTRRVPRPKNSVSSPTARLGGESPRLCWGLWMCWLGMWSVGKELRSLWGGSKASQDTRHSRTSPAMAHCVFGNLPFVLIIFYSISWWGAHPLRDFEFVVANWLQRASTASLKAELGKAELDLLAAFWRRSGGGGAVWREAGRWLV